MVDGSGNSYLKTVCDYVHLNPARAKLVPPEAALRIFPWSSWPAYLLAPSKRPAWLRVDRLLGECSIPKDSPAGRQRLEQMLEERRHAETDDEFKPVRRGWCLGGEEFRQELLAQMGERIGAEHYGEERVGDGPRQGGTPHRHGTAAPRLDRGRLADAPQRRCEESEAGAATTRRDRADGRMAGRAAASGPPGLRPSSALARTPSGPWAIVHATFGPERAKDFAAPTK